MASVDNYSMTVPNFTPNELIIRKGVKINVLPGDISVPFNFFFFSIMVYLSKTFMKKVISYG